MGVPYQTHVRHRWHMALLLGICVGLVAYPDPLVRALRSLGLLELRPQRQDGPSSPLGLAPRAARPLLPCDRPSAWAIHPARAPWNLAADGFQWRVLQESLALGLTFLCGKPCLDPVLVEESLVVLESSPRDGNGPKPDELRALARRLGVQHFLVPLLSRPSEGALEIRVLRADAETGFRPEVVARAPLVEPFDNVLISRGFAMVTEAAIQKLGSLAGATAGEPSAWGRPPVPARDLVERLLVRARRVESSPLVAAGWADLGLDTSTLGYCLAQGGAALGPRLLVRGAAQTALASLLAGDHPRVRLSLAMSLTLARHTRMARETLQPLLARGDREAKLVVDACRGDTRAIEVTPATAFLYRVACDRAGDFRILAARCLELIGAGLPLEFALAGGAHQMDVGSARLYTAMWAGGGSDDALRRGAMDLRETIVNAGRALRRHRPASPTSYAPMAAGLTDQGRHQALNEVAALAGAEYARVATRLWGVPEEARVMLSVLAEAFPDATSVTAAHWEYASEYERADRRDAAGRWWQSDPFNPWAARALVWAYAQGGDYRGAAQAGNELTDLGSTAVHLVRERYLSCAASRQWLMGAQRALADELTIDPGDRVIWRIRMVGSSTERTFRETRELVASARRELALSPALLLDEAQLMREHGSPVKAAELMREAIRRFPEDDAPYARLFDLYLAGRHMRLAEVLVDQMERAHPHSLGTVSAMCKLAEDHMDAGRLAEARGLVDRARRIEEWKEDCLLATARLLVREGKISEGLSVFDRSHARYRSAGHAIFLRVAALLEVGQAHRAIQDAEGTDPTALGNPVLLANLGRTFLRFGDRKRGLLYLERANALDRRAVEDYERTMLARPELAGNLRRSSDRRLLLEWVRGARGGSGAVVLNRISDNTRPVATEALIEGIRTSGFPWHCVHYLVVRAWVDLDLDHPRVAQADLDRAYERIRNWWQATRPGTSGR